MTASRVVADPWVGCVVSVETGVATVLTDVGELRASFGGGMLGLIACDRGSLPQQGDWVVLRRWPDRRVTVEAPLRCPPLPVRRHLRAVR